MKKIILGCLILVLSVSGCTEIPFLNNIFPSTTQVKELPPDLISIQDLTVIPSTSVRPGDQFSVSFVMKNQEENLPVNDITYNLFDTGLCTITTDSVDPATGSIDSLAPLESKFIEWTFDAPEADTIARLSTRCPIRFKVSYHYDAVSQIDVDVISKEKLTALQRAGNTPTFIPTLSVGRGPIKIYFDFGTSLPVRSGSTLPVYLQVEDKGTGLLTAIPAGTFSIKIPSDFGISDCTSYFPSCTSSSCTNVDQEIALIKKKSLQIKCSLTAPSGISDEKTYYITASVAYDYDVFGETSIEVKP